MIEIASEKKGEWSLIRIKGRIDGITVVDIERELNRLTTGGEHRIGLDFSQVNYISSTGLRVFLSTQKTLKTVGGELVLLFLPENILNVFQMVGFANYFKIISDIAEFENLFQPDEGLKTEFFRISGVHFELTHLKSQPGKACIIGSTEKLPLALYTEQDVSKVKPSELQYGTGLAALGDSYPEYKGLFGESLGINSNFYTYPAVTRSAVDFMLAGEAMAGAAPLTYKFLHGFGFSGPFSTFLQFEAEDSGLLLSDLISIAAKEARANLFGMVIIAVSAGLYGMNLKKSPILENRPLQGSILEPPCFADWFDFPIEPGFIGHIVAATGIAVKEKNRLSPDWISVLPQEANFHVHAGIFEKGLIAKKISEFQQELDRILKGLEVFKVQHLLGQTRFKSGLVGMIKLEKV